MAASVLEVGARIGGRYRIEGVLGRGGMGAVFRAFDESTERKVALKRLTFVEEELAFRREFHTLASLEHPNVVDAFDYGVDEGGAYYTMELLEGRELRELAGAPIEIVCRVVRHVASALAFLHARRLVHRDLSLRNVRLDASDSAKLIDFGLLSTAGANAFVAGTPPFTAPETLRGAPLDHRVDLFALGGVAYFLLTGEHAFPAKSFEQAEQLHDVLPASPRERRSNVPDALSDLVMRLLSVDPLGRPSSAAEVIDRVGRLLSLPETQGEIVRGYLSSTSFVGRRQEMATLGAALDETVAGNGGAFVFKAPSGAGKSRLLREITIEAKVRGAVSAYAEASSSRAPYALVATLVGGLLDAAGELVIETGRKRASRLAPILPNLAARLDEVPRGRSATEVAESIRSDPNEERLAVQAALHALFVEVAGARPVVLVVDELHRADEASLAVLASVAASARAIPLLIVGAVANDEAVAAPLALQDLERVSVTRSLRALEQGEVLTMLSALFGEVKNGGKLADAVHSAAGGNPLMCTELARHLVDAGVVRYVDGMWMVPDDVAIGTLPRGLEDALDARVRVLPAAEKRVAETVAVFGREIKLDLLARLVPGPTLEDLFASIDKLIALDVLVGDQRTLQLAHGGLRAALLRNLGPEARRDLHGRVADALAAAGDSDTVDGLVGEHLLRAGRLQEAAPLLYRAGKQLYERQSLRDAIPVLESALEAFGDDLRHEGVRGELRQLLMVSGAMADRDLVLRHGQSALDATWRQAGLDVGERAMPWIGRPLSICLSIAVAAARRLWSRRARMGAAPLDAMRSALMISGACFAAYAQLRDLRHMDALLDRLRIFDTLRSTVPHTAFRLSRGMLHIVSGNHASCRSDCTAALRALETDRWTPLSGYDRLVAEATIRNSRAWVSVVDQDTRFEEDIAAIEGMDLPSFAFSCAIYRAVFHRLRGEEPQALAMEEGAERIRVRLGTLWMWEGLLWQQSTLAYAFTRDALGLKRCIEALTRMERQGYLLGDYIELARANYLREHGEYDGALRSLETLERSLPSRTVLVQHVLLALAETALAAGDQSKTEEVLARARPLAEDSDKGMRSMQIRIARSAALLAAAKGDSARAFGELDRVTETAEAIGSPSLAGCLHEAGVVVAIAAHDMIRLQKHRDGAERWFRPTATPALIARLERIRALCEQRASTSSVAAKDVLTTLARPAS